MTTFGHPAALRFLRLAVPQRFTRSFCSLTDFLGASDVTEAKAGAEFISSLHPDTS